MNTSKQQVNEEPELPANCVVEQMTVRELINRENKDLLTQLITECEGMKKEQSKHDNHDMDSDSWCYECDEAVKEPQTNNIRYNQACDDFITLLKNKRDNT